MDETERRFIKAVVHYQQGLERSVRKNDEEKMLSYISRLFKMPVKVEHLEQTGVGRTVNSLRKCSGEVGNAAKTLVTKWKEMVMEGESNTSRTDTSTNQKYEPSSHCEESHSSKAKESEQSYRNQSKEKHHRSKRSNEDEDKDKRSESGRLSKSPGKSSKHKHSAKPIRESTESEASDVDVVKVKKHKHKHKSSKERHYSSDDSTNVKQNDLKRSSSKRKLEDDDCDQKLLKKNSDEDDYDQQLLTKNLDEDCYSRHKKQNGSSVDLTSKEVIKKSKSESTREEKIKPSSHKHHSKDKKDKSHKQSLDSKPKDKSSRSKEEDKKDKSTKNKSTKDHKSSKSSSKVGESGIGSSSGASFAEALGMLEPVSNKANKKKVAIVHPLSQIKVSSDFGSSSPEDTKEEIVNSLKSYKLDAVDINVSSLLPEITPNYRPLGNYLLSNEFMRNKIQNEDDTLVAIMNSKISRTKVYSGNKVAYSHVPSLFELCTRILKDNIDALEFTGGVPYDILKPVIERANPDQLFMLEHHNPYLIEDTDELWELHCQKEFRTKKRQELETWRDMYMRCLDERDAKLKALTANIKQAQDKCVPVRQTKLAYVDNYVKPPRNILRKQAKNGTAGMEKKPLMTPSSRLANIASSSSGQVSVPNPGARASGGHAQSSIKPKKAPLMQKTLAFMKNRHFRR